MNKILQGIYLIAGIFFSSAVLAAPALTRTTFAGTYTAITTAGGATVSTATGDNAFEDLIPIGFTFNYLGTNYTTIGVNTNGIAAFTGINASANNTDLYTSTAPNTLLAPWWDDLTASGGSILYQTQGVTGSRTFTVQWTNMRSFHTGATAQLNFQLVLFEADNHFEFRYGNAPAGTFNTSESACIGVKNATGGDNNFIDAITGSSRVGNAMVHASAFWPQRFFSFAPGLPSPLTAGTYHAGAGQDYPNLSEAVADLNHRGVAGAVSIALTDSLYDGTPANGNDCFPVLIGPVVGADISASIHIYSNGAILRSPGAQAGSCIAPGSASLITGNSDPVIGMVGALYTTLTNVQLEAQNNLADRGLSLLNASAALGTHNCGVQRVTVVLDHTNVNSIGIEQRVVVPPSGINGTNSSNVYTDIAIANAYCGMLMMGDPLRPDSVCSLGTVSYPMNFIGGNTSGNMGGGNADVYGIRAVNQLHFTLNNCVVRNLGAAGGRCEGIVLESLSGVARVYNNKIFNLVNTSATSTATVCGLRADLAASGTQRVQIYNNFIYGLSTAYSDAPSSARQLKGIFVQSGGNGMQASQIDVDFNSVLIDGSAATSSSTCFEIGTTNGPQMHVRNNIFCNATAAQIAPAGHFCWASPDAGMIGNGGSMSKTNDLFVANAAQGFAGCGGASNYSTLSDWQMATGQDSGSVALDPQFASTTNLHVNELGLNGRAIPLAYVTTDFDYEVRETAPDIGADEFSASMDIGAIALVAPVQGNCYSANEEVIVRIKNFSPGAQLNFAASPVAVYAKITGATTQFISTVITDDSINGGVPLDPGDSVDVSVGTFNMSGAGTFVFNAWTFNARDTITTNDTIPAMVSITFLPGTVSVAPASVCYGDSVTLTLSGNTAPTLQWQYFSGSWMNATGNGSTSSPYTILPSDTIQYRALVCGIPTDTMTVNVDSVPLAGFTYSIMGGVVYFNNTTQHNATYSWNFGDSQTSAQQDPSHVYGTSGSYTVVLTATNGCGTDTATAMIPFTVGIEETISSANVSVFPNPANDFVNVYLAGSGENIVIELFDMRGKLLQHNEPGKVTPGTNVTLNLSNYDEGLYLLIIRREGETPAVVNLVVKR